jgi:hypothetical protein
MHTRRVNLKTQRERRSIPFRGICVGFGRQMVGALTKIGDCDLGIFFYESITFLRK